MLKENGKQRGRLPAKHREGNGRRSLGEKSNLFEIKHVYIKANASFAERKEADREMHAHRTDKSMENFTQCKHQKDNKTSFYLNLMEMNLYLM